MKKTLIIAVVATGVLLGTLYAFGGNCQMCKGTGITGSIKCGVCNGTGRGQDY